MSNPNPPGTPPDQIAAAINQVQADKTPGPLEVNLSTGQVYKGETPQDVLNKLAAAQEEATRTIRSRESENAELRQRLANLEARAEREKPAETEDQTKNNEYYQTWSQKPGKATTMALANELGIPADQLIPMLKRTMSGGAINDASVEFMNRCPDFVQTPQNAELMKQGILQKFGGEPSMLKADDLELVYHDLVRNGRIQPGAVATTGFVDQNTPIPNIRGGSAPPNPMNDIMAQASQMPLEDLKKVIDRLHTQTGGR